MISRLPTLDLAYYPKEKGPYNNAELSQFLLDPKKIGLVLLVHQMQQTLNSQMLSLSNFGYWIHFQIIFQRMIT